jgi:enterochelin esterase family protein
MTAAPAVGEVVLSYPDPDQDLAGVALVGELWKRRPPLPFAHHDGCWELRLSPPPVDRFEYELQLTFPDGRMALALDPVAPVAPGPFGGKSVLELPAYAEPNWVQQAAPEGSIRSLRLPTARLRTAVEGLLWSPPGADAAEPLPLLVVHDGPEYAVYSELIHFLDVATAHERLPRLRAALLAPVLRSEHYSASARYSDALVEQLLPALGETAPSPTGLRPVGMGASLGALAFLHAHRRHPGAFAGLFLQSGSFFRQRFDRQESGFPRFRRITRFVGTVFGAAAWPDPLPVSLTCGTGEENRRNNAATAAALARQGYPVALAEIRDAHTWVGWRDALDPHLPELLSRAWS